MVQFHQLAVAAALLSSTALAADLRALVGAVTRANLATALDSMENITVFAPSNAAFAQIGSVTGNLSASMLASPSTKASASGIAQQVAGAVAVAQVRRQRIRPLNLQTRALCSAEV